MRIQIYDELVKEIVRLLNDYGEVLEKLNTTEMSGIEVVDLCRRIGDTKGMAVWLEKELKKQNEPTEVDPITDSHK